MKLATILLLVATVAPQKQAHPAPEFDPGIWTYFHPEAVISCECHVQPVTLLAGHGIPSEDRWESEANAKRAGMEDWALTLGMYPLNTKGFLKAMKDCEDWTIQAQERVKKAHPPLPPASESPHEDGK